jgi:hypothetical protein
MSELRWGKMTIERKKKKMGKQISRFIGPKTLKTKLKGVGNKYQKRWVGGW